MPKPQLQPGVWEAQIRSTRTTASADKLFAALFAWRGVDSFWLDSARSAYEMGRYSIMGALESTQDYRVVYSARSRQLHLGDINGEVIEHDVDIWEWLAHQIDLNPTAPLAIDLPFAGGYVGYIGYGTPSKGCTPRTDLRERDAEFLHITRFIVIDHIAGETHAVAVAPSCARAEAIAWTEHTVGLINATDDLKSIPQPKPQGIANSSLNIQNYLEDFSKVREWLVAGDSYEACYTYALSFKTREDSFTSYRRMRTTNPAPYGAFLRFGDRHVLSCSPERFLHVRPSGWAEAKPIKGTARRVGEMEKDFLVARKLSTDPKARSENLMIVDLLRNDLGLICSPGTVTVPQLMEVETYATVHQLVTSVRGKLLPRPAASVHAAKALFPSGSMTGAPKIRTVAMLDGLERTPRGVYSGVIGYFSRCGSTDLSVVIRTAVIDGNHASIGTGGAITIQSSAHEELDETLAKSDALLEAFGRTHPMSSGEDCG